MTLRNLKSLPGPLLAVALGFALFPLWSLTLGDPLAAYLRTGNVAAAAIPLATYWFLPLTIVFLTLRRSLVVLPLFIVECGALVVQTLMTPVADSPYLQAARIALLVGMCGLGFLLMSKEIVFPLLKGGGRRWRGAPRIYANQRATVRSFGGHALEAKAMIENFSLSGLLLSGLEADFGPALNNAQPGDGLKISIPVAGSVHAVTGILVWHDTTGPMVRLGFHALTPVPVDAMIRAANVSGTPVPISAWARFQALSGAKVATMALWAAVVGGTLGIPHCGVEDGLGVARVTDAPPGEHDLAYLDWRRSDGEDAFGLTQIPYELSSAIEGCKSGYAARIDWREDNDAPVPIPLGDVGCKATIAEIKRGTDMFVLANPGGQPFNAGFGVTNTFKSAKGETLVVTNTKVLPSPMSGTPSVLFKITEIQTQAPVVVKVELPQEACVIKALGDPMGDRVTFEVRLHPAYLPHAQTLTFFPCGEAQQWDSCSPKSLTGKQIKFKTTFTKRQPKKPIPYAVAARVDVKNAAIRDLAMKEGKSLSCAQTYYMSK